MYKKVSSLLLAGIAVSFNATAELLDRTKVDTNGTVNAPLGVINKSLAQQVGAGQGDVHTPGSSVFLIKRDPARSIRRGRQLFQRKFSPDEGLGPRVNFSASGDITQTRALGAGAADSCALCHGRPKGSAGSGGDVATRPDSRDAPHLFGLGLVEQLADEMTQQLRGVQDQAVAAATGAAVCDTTPTNAAAWVPNVSYQLGTLVSFAAREYRAIQAHVSEPGWEPADQPSLWTKSTPSGLCHWDVQVSYPINARVFHAGRIWRALQAHTSQIDWSPPNVPALWTQVASATPTTRTLVAKGINFGTISIAGDATISAAGVRGVDPDLRVRPFFHHGGTVSMREFAVGAFKDEMGLEAFDPILCAVTDPQTPRPRVSPSGFVFDPVRDKFERPHVCSRTADNDGDGITNEIDTALLDHMEFYLLNYFKAGRGEVTQRAQQGLALLNQIGCTGCHVQNLTIDRDRRVADIETVFDPARGILNDLFGTAATRFTVVQDGDPAGFPLLLPQGQPFVVANFFSDLKRHDLGPAFWEREYDGTLVKQFVTEPLWGVATSGPYGHDGRSINLDSAIRRHGGEAQTQKRAYVALSADDQRKIQEFLQTLVLFPPDDTASTLNPGEPNNPSDPNNDPFNNPNIQDPAVRGSFNLGALFQIPSEGQE